MSRRYSRSNDTTYTRFKTIEKNIFPRAFGDGFEQKGIQGLLDSVKPVKRRQGELLLDQLRESIKLRTSLLHSYRSAEAFRSHIVFTSLLGYAVHRISTGEDDDYRIKRSLQEVWAKLIELSNAEVWDENDQTGTATAIWYGFEAMSEQEWSDCQSTLRSLARDVLHIPRAEFGVNFCLLVNGLLTSLLALPVRVHPSVRAVPRPTPSRGPPATEPQRANVEEADRLDDGTPALAARMDSLTVEDHRPQPIREKAISDVTLQELELQASHAEITTQITTMLRIFQGKGWMERAATASRVFWGLWLDFDAQVNCLCLLQGDDVFATYSSDVLGAERAAIREKPDIADTWEQAPTPTHFTEAFMPKFFASKNEFIKETGIAMCLYVAKKVNLYKLNRLREIRLKFLDMLATYALPRAKAEKETIEEHHMAILGWTQAPDNTDIITQFLIIGDISARIVSLSRSVLLIDQLRIWLHIVYGLIDEPSTLGDGARQIVQQLRPFESFLTSTTFPNGPPNDVDSWKTGWNAMMSSWNDPAARKAMQKRLVRLAPGKAERLHEAKYRELNESKDVGATAARLVDEINAEVDTLPDTLLFIAEVIGHHRRVGPKSPVIPKQFPTKAIGRGLEVSARHPLGEVFFKEYCGACYGRLPAFPLPSWTSRHYNFVTFCREKCRERMDRTDREIRQTLEEQMIMMERVIEEQQLEQARREQARAEQARLGRRYTNRRRRSTR
ncbi:hypothetical protein BDZ85DRAFT_281771 [Elsinoe ampelina]|uniref:Uncharacterized protein n=1 Tax=Elsinoe ampelina TaxID=302913 RepID=A0A6A6GEC8_9PEZI|nr:hypothetical protein BDZ85DRAFT_281771 [Elsinoe ampelina]